MSPDRYTVAVDFDGVIHAFDTPWTAVEVIPDPPVEGAMDWLVETIQHLDVVIFSVRGRRLTGRRAMRDWLREHTPPGCWQSRGGVGGKPTFHGLDSVRFVTDKPPCLLYLDDRGWRFEGPGTFPTVGEICTAAPWNKRESGTSGDDAFPAPTAP